MLCASCPCLAFVSYPVATLKGIRRSTVVFLAAMPALYRKCQGRRFCIEYPVTPASMMPGVRALSVRRNSRSQRRKSTPTSQYCSLEENAADTHNPIICSRNFSGEQGVQRRRRVCRGHPP